MSGFMAILRRDIGLAFRQGGGSFLALGFFVITVAIFPFGVGPGPELLARIAAGVIWVAALLATLLSLDRLFQADFEDGSLDLLVLAPQPLELTVLAKCLAQWITTALPLIVVAPVLGVLMQLPDAGYLPLILTMLLGTPALSLFGAIGAALTVGVHRGGVLIPLLVLPLYVPVLIFAIGAVEAALTGLPNAAHLMLLGALSLFALVLAPIASAAALRLSLT